MIVFYRPEQNVEENDSFSPSAGKPAQVIASWHVLDLAGLDIARFSPVTPAQLYQVHSKDYVDGVLNCWEPNGFGNTLPGVAKALPFVAGSMVAATLYAQQFGGITFSPTSGAHHACYSHGGGYCTFNFLMLAAVEAIKAGAKRVGIIDCDMHGGNGTEDIIDTLHLKPKVQHYSFGYDRTFDKLNVEEWLHIFGVNVYDITNKADVVIYNAGADPHVDDPLGGALTTLELMERDMIVFKTAKRLGKPIAVSLAGGYQSPLRKTLDIHDNTYHIAREIFA